MVFIGPSQICQHFIFNGLTPLVNINALYASGVYHAIITVIAEYNLHTILFLMCFDIVGTIVQLIDNVIQYQEG